jgi:NADH-quinone oxidoreductase E subunit
MPLLTLAQQQNDGWIPQAAIEHIASILGLAPIKVQEVASFYTMYNLAPVGKHHLQVCVTTPCWLRGSDEVMKACEGKLGVKAGETTPDGLFTLTEVECLGACVNAPMMQVTSSAPHRDGFYEDLTPHLTMGLIDALAAGNGAEFSSLAGRKSSEPSTGATTLSHGKIAAVKLDAAITTMEDTGEPTAAALELVNTPKKKPVVKKKKKEE